MLESGGCCADYFVLLLSGSPRAAWSRISFLVNPRRYLDVKTKGQKAWGPILPGHAHIAALVMFLSSSFCLLLLVIQLFKKCIS